MPFSHEVKFLLDENISYGVKKLLNSKNYVVDTVQDLKKRGIKNTELMELARMENSTLITSDKDFLYLNKEPEDSIILIDIHPFIDENVLPAFEKFLEKFSQLDLKNNIVVLYKTSFKLKSKRASKISN
ncbi:MAG: DUF5615 family PIN-like protein [Candidatus Hodarchaeota archaeon]